jgi:NAD(P)H-nitrite reductase large subunit
MPLTWGFPSATIVRLSLNRKIAKASATGESLMSFAPESIDPVICHCLGIAASEIRAAAEFGDCQTVSDVKHTTAAGSGCTSCHRRIIGLLRSSCREAAAAT